MGSEEEEETKPLKYHLHKHSIIRGKIGGKLFGDFRQFNLELLTFRYRYLTQLFLGEKIPTGIEFYKGTGRSTY